MSHHLLCCFVVSLSLISTVSCLSVNNAEQLINLFKNAAGSALDEDIEMLDDLDFSYASLRLPLGASSNGTCVPFSGKLQGNGHSIHGVVMKNQDRQVFNDAGLFCILKDAIVENLVIDPSCSFNGSSAGALCVSVNGSLVIRNVTNKAEVYGTRMVGGFVGYVREMRDDSVSFEDCVNDGIVTGSERYIGGLIGRIWGNMNMTVTLSNTLNNGHVNGSEYQVGGFVGEICGNIGIIIDISNSINKGTVTGNGNVGGFVGEIYSNIDMNMTFSNTTNNGNVNEIVTGSVGFVGGFVGLIHSYQLNSISLFIINNANKGSVQAKSGMACGVFCVDEVFNFNVNTTILNTINKGSVNARADAFGITNNVTKARNVVSMGDVTGPSGSYSFTFWKSSTDVDLFFGLKSKCKNCAKMQNSLSIIQTLGFMKLLKVINLCMNS